MPIDVPLEVIRSKALRHKKTYEEKQHCSDEDEVEEFKRDGMKAVRDLGGRSGHVD